MGSEDHMVTSSNRNALAILVLILIAISAVFYLNQPVHRTTSEKIGDAINALPQGPDAAGRQLEDRTKGQELGDRIKKAAN
jgi:hypothetical protein